MLNIINIDDKQRISTKTVTHITLGNPPWASRMLAAQLSRQEKTRRSGFFQNQRSGEPI
jgi:hypothetical protein